MKILTMFLLIAICLFTVSATNQKPAYEYKVENGVSEGKINSLANQGWEVVTAGQFASPAQFPYVILRRQK